MILDSSLYSCYAPVILADQGSFGASAGKLPQPPPAEKQHQQQQQQQQQQTAAKSVTAQVSATSHPPQHQQQQSQPGVPSNLVLNIRDANDSSTQYWVEAFRRGAQVSTAAKP